MNYQLKRKMFLAFLGFVVIMLPLFIIFTQPVNSHIKPQQDRPSAIHQVLSEIVSDRKAPGMIAAIISSKGIVAIGSAGVRKAGSNIAMTTNDLVHLGSCTKAMTAVMLATLVAEEKLGWETKLIEAIPELKSIHPDYQNITLWQLLTHRAGIPANAMDWGAHTQKEIKERRLAILEDNLSSSRKINQGEFEYSNLGYMIAACMAEKITGLSWEFLIKKRLFDPLGMSSAGFGEPDARNTIDQPWGHSKWIGKWKPRRSYDPEAIGPAGVVHCTIEDWAKFISLQLPGKNPILDPEYLNKLVEPIGFYAGGWGIIDGQEWAKGKIFTHDGSNGIWYVIVVIMPGLNRAFVVATNSCDFSSTSDTCTKILTRLKTIDLSDSTKQNKEVVVNKKKISLGSVPKK